MGQRHPSGHCPPIQLGRLATSSCDTPSPVPVRFLANWLASPQWLVQSRCEGSASCDCGPPLPRPRRWLEKSSTGSVVRSTKAESMAALSGSLRYDGRIGENSRRHRLIGASPSGKQEALMPAAMEGKRAIQGRTRTLFRRNVSLKRCRNRYFRMPN